MLTISVIVLLLSASVPTSARLPGNTAIDLHNVITYIFFPEVDLPGTIANIYSECAMDNPDKGDIQQFVTGIHNIYDMCYLPQNSNKGLKKQMHAGMDATWNAVTNCQMEHGLRLQLAHILSGNEQYWHILDELQKVNDALSKLVYDPIFVEYRNLVETQMKIAFINQERAMKLDVLLDDPNLTDDLYLEMLSAHFSTTFDQIDAMFDGPDGGFERECDLYFELDEANREFKQLHMDMLNEINEARKIVEY